MNRAAQAALLLFLLLFLFAPFLVNPGLVFLAGFAMIQIVFALSWNLLFSYAGLISFGHAAFFGIGAYISAVALRDGYEIHFVLLILVCAAFGALAALLVALVVLRRASGVQFAVLTLALSQLIVVLIGYSSLLGHDEGIAAIPRPAIDFGLFTVDMNQPLTSYYFVLAVCLLAVGLMWLLAKGHVGRAMRAVRIDAERAAFVGIDVWRVRVIAFTISGAFAAVAGAMLAPWSQIITPDYVNWLQSAQPLFAALLGGAGFFWGPVVGVIGLSGINYLTRTFAGLSEVLVGASLILVVLVAPQGILGALKQLARRRGGRTPGGHA
ncbi:branched-chain amino acid ABC transporter permease [Aquamicrobium sp. LC103]|uniref:branched-chain amino acid ABC transporter permease n=1 Tax=Aquamicrobium sp. LC103 TaxID=1120658 RepID=UPI00063E795D|nr:branched-chain amino acid ABC transporter permease [Aquamicrobium sp. LC103]TKT78387.1 branched-chain amino acid ABC transporter permease [Aquamicrobium sp. LC103]